MINKPIHSALLGIAIGDALGVPVEFKPRQYLKENPVTDMIGFGSHNQEAGTWSDDSSLTFCLAQMLYGKYNLEKLASNFINWKENAYWSARGEVFDIGIATSNAIEILKQGINPVLAGGEKELDNGNGSLMRILPLLFYVKNMPIEQRFKHVADVSSLTHRHIRSVLACFIYIEYALQLFTESDKYKALDNTKNIVNSFLNTNAICSEDEINKFHRILQNPIDEYDVIPIYEYAEDEISSSGYVVHSLEAALWCLFKNNTYSDTVLHAVNLGNDTDTTAAIVGGLAGLLYGYESIPQHWLNQLARKDDIIDLCDKLEKKFI